MSYNEIDVFCLIFGCNETFGVAAAGKSLFDGGV